MPAALADTYQSGGVDIRDPQAFAGDRRALEATGRWAAKNPYDAASLALSPVPLIGDVAGVANDVRTFATDPESRTLLNYGLSATGLLPVLPSFAGVLKAKIDPPEWAEPGSGVVHVFENPTRKEVANALGDPAGKGYAAYLGDGAENYYVWRRYNAPLHGQMAIELEKYDVDIPGNKAVPRGSFGSLDEAEDIMGRFGSRRR